ncbi:type II secretion system F family protein [Enterovibrio baiacu]|uniref:type II secretion system F family protein n=1 Tax=Enterovibrio baiacu TaxID=2491023 RepID=UPI0010124E48|nr:type II secretion system F family protein [Enterovibrio baiacu]MBE1276660.1 pilus assembly protein TadB [Enterovibrio baiacu]
MIANAIYCLMIIFGLYVLFNQSRLKKRRESMLRDSNTLPETKFLENRAVDMDALTETTFLQRVQRNIGNTLEDLGDYSAIKIFVFYGVTLFAGDYMLGKLFHLKILTSVLITWPVVTFLGLRYLKIRAHHAFEQSFPDALNMIASSVSAGESLLHAIVFVGDSLDSVVGKEFKRMGERLHMGESTDAVFRKACLRFPTPMFQFFVITMRVNVNRGGQLREVITRLNRVLFDARSIEKKKLAMTAEARISSYIVCAIPFIFLFALMPILSPENYDYVMNDPSGRPLLYYMLISEAIGMTIITLLMRSVR